MAPVVKHHLKTGGDPRTFSDFSSLRDELNKLTHPARPDVNWSLVERLSLNLFEKNGVELQTAAWYTLARTHLNGITGLSEGLEIINALITWQWASIWPSSAHARIEILSALSKRLQQTFRMLPLQRTDLGTLFAVETSLSTIESALQRLELRHVSGLEPLRLMVKNAGVKLENSELEPTQPIALQGEVLPTLPARSAPEEAESAARWVFVVTPPPPDGETEVHTEPAKRSSPTMVFICGFVTAALFGLLMFFALPHWLSLPEKKALLATVDPLPGVMPASDIAQLRKASPGWLHTDSDYDERLNKQLERLSELSPIWTLQYGGQLVDQTSAIFPDSAQASDAQKKWRAILTANALPYGNIKGWHEGIQQLQQLQEKLNDLDEKKGRYMTVSELKTAVFTISKSFNSSVPVEELIRQLQNAETNQTVSPALLSQTDSTLQQLINSYMLAKFAHDHP